MPETLKKVDAYFSRHRRWLDVRVATTTRGPAGRGRGEPAQVEYWLTKSTAMAFGATPMLKLHERAGGAGSARRFGSACMLQGLRGAAGRHWQLNSKPRSIVRGCLLSGDSTLATGNSRWRGANRAHRRADLLAVSS